MNCKTTESLKFKKRLGFNLHDVVNTKEQTVLEAIKEAFEGKNMQTQYSVLGYRIDLYFHDFKLAIEIDELGHNDRNINRETERQNPIERIENNLTVNLLGLVLMEKILIFLKPSTKYTNTLKNQPKSL